MQQNSGQKNQTSSLKDQEFSRGKEQDLPKGEVKEIKLLWAYLSPYKKVIVGAFVALIIASMATLAVPQALKRIIDEGFGNVSTNLIDQYFLALGAVAIILGLATFSRYFLVTWLGERVVADIRKSVFNQIISLSPTFFEQNRSGDILSRLTTDTTVIQSVVGSSASVALRNIITLVGGIIAMGFTSLKLLSVVLIVVPLIVFPILFLGRKVKKLSRASQDKMANFSAIANETIGAVSTVQAFTRENYEKQKLSKVIESAFSVAVKRIRVRAILTAIVIFLVFGAIDLVLWVGASDVIKGDLTGGDLTAFLMYAVLTAGALGSLSEVYAELQRAAGAASRCVELIATTSDIISPKNPIKITESKGNLSFENVTFSYPARPNEHVLKDFSLDIKAGETIAIVGPSGAGKTTVFQLLQRFYDPQSGRIIMDGVDIAQAELQEFRSHMAIVPQESIIFAASVSENIKYGDLEASDEAVLSAAESAEASEFIAKLPEKMDSYLGERGTMLSGGQKQRIAIARAILRNAPILLLDEATSALDAQSERKVQTALDQLMEKRTTLVVAHRLATILKADRIVVMKEGRIIDIGRHEELLAKDGLYSRLAKLQFNQI
jgi:ATP-binding cassette subfamily B protein